MALTEEELLNLKRRFDIIGHAPALNHAISVAAQVAPTDMTVLITGESGSGKESFSKIIHQLSRRKHGTFIAINCGAIPSGTIDSELFGHEKGAFTGAHDSRKGYFEVTDGGTLFLDEVGEMPLETQARLLRVLENGEFIRVGSSKNQKTDVRVVAATNCDLREAVGKGQFREDLYYRLSTVPIYVPPLRERGRDIVLLFRKFASDFSEKYHVEPVKLSPDAEEVWASYSFPGNIRQLKNIVEQLSVLEVNREIDAETLRRYLPDESRRQLPLALPPGSNAESFSERELLYKVLFEMRRDITELKKLVFKILKNEEFGSEIINQNAELFEHMEREYPELPQGTDTSQNPVPLLLEANKNNGNNFREEPSGEYARYQEVEEPSTEHHGGESLSLEEHEKELIVKALKKNRNRRKYAAQDLGISERTLYRKIKQYDLE